MTHFLDMLKFPCKKILVEAVCGSLIMKDSK